MIEIYSKSRWYEIVLYIIKKKRKKRYLLYTYTHVCNILYIFYITLIRHDRVKKERMKNERNQVYNIRYLNMKPSIVSHN